MAASDRFLACSVALGSAPTGRRDDAFEATVAALAHYAVAGSRAHRKADGPGSFQVHFLDALAAVTPEALDLEAEIEWP